MKQTENTTTSGLKTFSLGHGGPHLLFIGGGPGIGSRVYREALSALADRFHCHFWDFRGTGSSGPARRPSFAQDAEDLNEVVRELGLEKGGYSLCGHSYGGLLVLKKALESAVGLRALVLISTAPSLKPVLSQIGARKLRRLGPQDHDRHQQSLIKALSDPAATREREEFLDLEFRCQFLNLPAETRARFMRDLEFSFTVFAGNADGYELDYTPDLPRIGLPSLIVNGREDLIIPPEFSHSLRSLPQAQEVEIPDCGHWPFLEKPAAFAKALADFGNHL